MNRTGKFDGIDVVSTTELCERLGMQVSSTLVKDLNVVSPMAETSTGIYWRESHVPLIAMALAQRLTQRAIDQQIILNAGGQ